MSHDTVFAAGGPLIVGAGLAGLFCALKLAPAPCVVLSPAPLGRGASSAWAQGGVAAAVAEGDSAAAHAADTVAAGAGLVDDAVAAGVAAEAAARVEDLARLGAPFDRDAEGRLVASREAAHSAARVVRVGGDGAGAAIMATLIRAVRAAPSVTVMEGLAATDLAVADGRVVGVFARRVADPTAAPILVRAPAAALATGGIGGLYAVTTNPGFITGAGLGMAARAGAVIADPEFVQFHPTGLAVDADPTPLASEAIRGEGATLIDAAGERFMRAVHPDAELAPRDVVARAIHARVSQGEPVYLDARAALGAGFAAQFPAVAAHCRAAGVDPATQPIPVRPAQHYHMGGVETDAAGRASLPGLWAVGEAARTGLHGANRLASNSLLEALVFAARAAEGLQGVSAPTASPAPPAATPDSDAAPTALEATAALRQAMTADVGVARDAEGLRRALRAAAAFDRAAGPVRPAARNMAAAATLIAAAALRRRESRGGHWRDDFPQTDPVAAPTRITLTEALAIRAEAEESAP